MITATCRGTPRGTLHFPPPIRVLHSRRSCTAKSLLAEDTDARPGGRDLPLITVSEYNRGYRSDNLL